MAPTDRVHLITELDVAKREVLRCMGGVDQHGCIAAAIRVTELRNQLRDDELMFAHFAEVVKPATDRARRRARSYRS